MKRIAILPTLLTLGNGVCGFLAIIMASKIVNIDPALTTENDSVYLITSGWLILVAMVFDMLDGYVARLSRSASKFGGELDSLCDAISFGVAPAFLLYQMARSWELYPVVGKALIGVAILYVVCALLRLARFNVENTPDPASHKRFRGLPSPAAGGCLASLAILYGELPGKVAMVQRGLEEPWPALEATYLRQAIIVWAFLGGLLVTLLMVSRVPYPRTTRRILRGRRHFSHLVQVILFVFIIVLLRELALVFLFWIYALGIPVRYNLERQFFRQPLPTPRLEDTLP